MGTASLGSRRVKILLFVTLSISIITLLIIEIGFCITTKGMNSMNKVQYNVSGLQNTQIKTQVKNVLDELDGVNKVNVDLGRSSIEVEFNDETNENDIRKGIEQVGCKIES